MATKNTTAISLELQNLGRIIDRKLQQITGERQFFFLLVSSDGVVQYLGNGERKDSVMLMETQLEHWQQKRADIPAHYNPAFFTHPPKKG